MTPHSTLGLVLDRPIGRVRPDAAAGVGRLDQALAQAVFDVEGGAELVERVRARGRPLAQAEEPVSELLAVANGRSEQWRNHRQLRENGADADRADVFQIAQEPPGVGRGLRRKDADEAGASPVQG